MANIDMKKLLPGVGLVGVLAAVVNTLMPNVVPVAGLLVVLAGLAFGLVAVKENPLTKVLLLAGALAANVSSAAISQVPVLGLLLAAIVGAFGLVLAVAGGLVIISEVLRLAKLDVPLLTK